MPRSGRLRAGTESESPEPQRRVCILGASVATGNMGVSALATSVVALLLCSRRNTSVSFCIGSQTSDSESVRLGGNDRTNVKVVNFRMSPRARLNEHIVCIVLLAVLWRMLPAQTVRRRILAANRCIRELWNADWVGDINGGDSFSDIYGIDRFLVGVAPSIVCVLLGKRLVLLPQTYGPYRSWLARWVARRVLVHAAVILARDEESADSARRMLPRPARARVAFCPDVALALASVEPSGTWATPPIPSERDGLVIGINVSGLLWHGGYTGRNMFGLTLDYRQFVRKLVAAVMADGNRVVLVPHNYGEHGDVNNDLDACQTVYDELHGPGGCRLHLVTHEKDQSELKGIIGQFDFFIGSRMHSCIAALSAGVPAVAVAYSSKFEGVFATLGVRDMVVDGRNATTEQAIAGILSAIAARIEVCARLGSSVASAKLRLLACFQQLLA